MGMSCIIRIEIPDKQIKEIVEEIGGWYGILIKPKRVRFLLKNNPNVAWQIKEFGFDTETRESFLNVLAEQLTGLPWPIIGDDKKTKMRFEKRLRLVVKNMDPDVKLSEEFTLLD